MMKPDGRKNVRRSRLAASVDVRSDAKGYIVDGTAGNILPHRHRLTIPSNPYTIQALTFRPPAIMPIATPRPLTQGQSDVSLDLVQPYSNFPLKVTGPTVWKAEDFRSKPDLWKKQWSAEQIRDLEQAYDLFKESGKPITSITKVSLFEGERKPVFGMRY